MTFASDGVSFDPTLLDQATRLQAIGPGTLADLRGELSTGFQQWVLTVVEVDSIDWCLTLYPEAGERSSQEFRRGDVDGSGQTSAIPDALYLLRWFFSGGPDPVCEDAADADDNGVVSALPDGLFLLQWGFLETDAPPSPGPDECGEDPVADNLPCWDYPECP